MNDDVSFEEWNTLSDAQWRNILTTEWGRDFISLSAAVWWIALSGKPGECDDDALERAASDLISKLRTGALPMCGEDHSKKRERISHEQIPLATGFFGDYQDLVSFGDRRAVTWDQMLEGGERNDKIETRAEVIWSHLEVERGQLLAIWPVHAHDIAAWGAELESRIHANPALTQSAAILAMKNFCRERRINVTEKQIKAAWKRANGIEGKAKTGPVGPKSKAR